MGVDVILVPQVSFGRPGVVVKVMQSRDLNTGLLSAKAQLPVSLSQPQVSDVSIAWQPQASVAPIKHLLQAKSRAKPSILEGPQVCAPKE